MLSQCIACATPLPQFHLVSVVTRTLTGLSFRSRPAVHCVFSLVGMRLKILLGAGALSTVAPLLTGSRCADLSSATSTDYWTSVSACSPCVKAGCAFSLSSLLCSDDDGVDDAATLVRGSDESCPCALTRAPQTRAACAAPRALARTRTAVGRRHAWSI